MAREVEFEAIFKSSYSQGDFDREAFLRKGSGNANRIGSKK